MKSIVKVLIIIILIFIAYMVTEVNTQILSYTSQVYIEWLPKWYDNINPLIKALGISVSTIIIIISYESKWIRGLFITLDGSIVWMFQFINKDVWQPYTSYYYGLMTALILLFIGNLAHRYYIKSNSNQLNEQDSNININQLLIDMEILKLENRTKELSRLMVNLKRGNLKKPWYENSDKKQKMTEYELEQSTINKKLDNFEN